MSGNQTPALTLEQFSQIIHPSLQNIVELDPIPRYHGFALSIIGINKSNSSIFDEVRERRPDLVSKVDDALGNHDWSIPLSQKLRHLAQELYQEYLTMNGHGHPDKELNLEVYM